MEIITVSDFSRCGRTPIPPSLLSVSALTSTAIVGGAPATPYSWPWQAVVCKNGELFSRCFFLNGNLELGIEEGFWGCENRYTTMAGGGVQEW